MSNIFISKTKSFYNYITSTHCKDFKDKWEEFYKNQNEYEKKFYYGISFQRAEKKTYNSLNGLYFFLFSENRDFIDIKNYIFEKSSEEEEFENWAKLLKNFADYIYKYIDPMFICPAKDSCFVTKDQDNTKLTINMENFDFSINFERSKIKKNNSTLFDSIVGLDKENTLSFINIKITNKMSNKIYSYEYIEDSGLISKDGLDDEICDIQLEMVKEKLDRFIFNYIGIVFDEIVNRELKLEFKDFRLFNSTFIKTHYKELEERWLENTNTESD